MTDITLREPANIEDDLRIIEGGIVRAVEAMPELQDTYSKDQLRQRAQELLSAFPEVFSHELKAPIGERRQIVADFLRNDPVALGKIVAIRNGCYINLYK